MYTGKGEMSARSFNPESDDEVGGQPAASNEGENSNESGTESEEEAEDVQPPPAKKKRAASEQREWTEMNRWLSNDTTDAEILIFIRRELDELNSS